MKHKFTWKDKPISGKALAEALGISSAALYIRSDKYQTDIGEELDIPREKRGFAPHEVIETGTKTRLCKGPCGERKNIAHFGFHKNGIDKLNPNCKACCSAYSRDRYERHGNDIGRVGSDKKNPVATGVRVIHDGKLFEVCNSMNNGHGKPDVVANRVMQNGQVLKNTSISLFGSWEYA